MIAFDEAVEKIEAEDPRFDPDAYGFVRESLDDGIVLFKKPMKGPGRHLSGVELLEAFRLRALREFGPMSARVLKTWGVHSTDDVGKIVFRLVEAGVLGKTPEDRMEDFQSRYSFEEAFVIPFQPGSVPALRSGPTDAG